MSSFYPTKKWYTKTGKCGPYTGKKQAREIIFERVLADKHLRVAIVDIFKEPKENILKEVNEGMMTMSQWIENSNKEVEREIKETKRNF